MKTSHWVVIVFLGGTVTLTADATSNLSSCNNRLSQNYTTTTHNSTSINTVEYSYYVSPNCNFTADFTIQNTHGALTLKSPSGTFSYCSNNSKLNSLGNIGCSSLERSLRITSLTTNTGTYMENGDCITLVCSGTSFSSWSITSTNTIVL